MSHDNGEEEYGNLTVRMRKLRFQILSIWEGNCVSSNWTFPLLLGLAWAVVCSMHSFCFYQSSRGGICFVLETLVERGLH
jgi:hypothetical protein